MKKTKVVKVELARHVLAPLLDSVPRSQGEAYAGKLAFCLSCGATDKVAMIGKHKKGCPYVAHWRAVEALRNLLGVEE